MVYFDVSLDGPGAFISSDSVAIAGVLKNSAANRRAKPLMVERVVMVLVLVDPYNCQTAP